MDYWKNYAGVFLKEEDVEMVKLMHDFVEKEIMSLEPEAKRKIFDDLEWVLKERLLEYSI